MRIKFRFKRESHSARSANSKLRNQKSLKKYFPPHWAAWGAKSSCNQMLQTSSPQSRPSRFAHPNGARFLVAGRVFAPRCKPAPSACKTLAHHPLGPVLSRRKVCENDQKIFLVFPLKSYHLQTFAKYFAILVAYLVEGLQHDTMLLHEVRKGLRAECG